MDQYITINSSEQHPSDFVSNFTDAISLNDGYEVAVTQIFHAPVYNVTERNNKFSLVKDTTIVDHYIPVGYYAGTCDVMDAIYEVLETARKSGSNEHGSATLVKTPPVFAYAKNTGEASSLKLADAGVSFIVDNERDDDAMVLKLLGYCVSARFDKITINHFNFDVSTEAGFLYSDIVANTMINQQQSRLLSLIPLRSKPGYNYYEFINPVYGTLSVHSFTDIAFRLTNVHGEVVSMAHTHSSHWGRSKSVIYPTIITLHIRKIYK